MNNKLTKELDIVEQEKPFANLDRFLIDDVDAHKIVVVGKCGATKTLLLKHSSTSKSCTLEEIWGLN